MSDIWAGAAADWGYRSNIRVPALDGLDCPPDGGGGGGNGGGGGSGGGGSGGGGGTGDCCQGRCSCHRGCSCPEGGGECHHWHECHCHGRVGHESRCHHTKESDGLGGAAGYAKRSGSGRSSAASRRPGVTLGWNNPQRPGRHYGVSTGRLPGGVVDPCDFQVPPWDTWPGTRGDLYLPYLLMRANAGDLGARPVVGPFWESPDILLLAGVDPAQAPDQPPDLGQTALADRPNTIYAHVWNFGRSSAPNVVVEFSWCDPSIGIAPGGLHLIGATVISLGDRSSGRSHRIVKCPVAWVPTFLNGGHECLLVRAWDESSDGLGAPQWDAALNRHVAQRNIHVAAAGEQANTMRLLRGATLEAATTVLPITFKVGPLYGEAATVAVERAAPHSMPWLQLRTGVRGQFPTQAPQTGDVQLSAPTTVGGGPTTGDAGTSHQVAGDDQEVTLSTGDVLPPPGQAHIYRVMATQQGQVFGGYTVVLLG
jgi:hypothetical protein